MFLVNCIFIFSLCHIGASYKYIPNIVRSHVTHNRGSFNQQSSLQRSVDSNSVSTVDASIHTLATGHSCGSKCCIGWIRDSFGLCTIPICRPPCRNSAICVKPNKCKCPKNFWGSRCSHKRIKSSLRRILDLRRKRNRIPRQSLRRRTFLSPPSQLRTRIRYINTDPLCRLKFCTNGGRCVAGRCICPQLFTGPRCEVYLRRKTSYNYNRQISTGTHASSSTSSRRRGFTLRLCLSLCKSHGKCKRAIGGKYACVCDPDYRGLLCTIHVQPSTPIRQTPRPSITRSIGLPSQNPGSSNLLPDLPKYVEVGGTALGKCYKPQNGVRCVVAFTRLMSAMECCVGRGEAWGPSCTSCSFFIRLQKSRHRSVSCRRGFTLANDLCKDVNECDNLENCQNGVCFNTRGSYSCQCNEGYHLQTSSQSCLRNRVPSGIAKCYVKLSDDGKCLNEGVIHGSKRACCCSVGKAWGSNCDLCPTHGSSGHRSLCPSGGGYFKVPSSNNNNNIPSTGSIDYITTENPGSSVNNFRTVQTSKIQLTKTLLPSKVLATSKILQLPQNTAGHVPLTAATYSDEHLPPTEISSTMVAVSTDVATLDAITPPGTKSLSIDRTSVKLQFPKLLNPLLNNYREVLSITTQATTRQSHTSNSKAYQSSPISMITLPFTRHPQSETSKSYSTQKTHHRDTITDIEQPNRQSSIQPQSLTRQGADDAQGSSHYVSPLTRVGKFVQKSAHKSIGYGLTTRKNLNSNQWFTMVAPVKTIPKVVHADSLHFTTFAKSQRLITKTIKVNNEEDKAVYSEASTAGNHDYNSVTKNKFSKGLSSTKSTKAVTTLTHLNKNVKDFEPFPKLSLPKILHKPPLTNLYSVPNTYKDSSQVIKNKVPHRYFVSPTTSRHNLYNISSSSPAQSSTRSSTSTSLYSSIFTSLNRIANTTVFNTPTTIASLSTSFFSTPSPSTKPLPFTASSTTLASTDYFIPTTVLSTPTVTVSRPHSVISRSTFTSSSASYNFPNRNATPFSTTSQGIVTTLNSSPTATTNILSATNFMPFTVSTNYLNVSYLFLSPSLATITAKLSLPPSTTTTTTTSTTNPSTTTSSPTSTNYFTPSTLLRTVNSLSRSPLSASLTNETFFSTSLSGFAPISTTVSSSTSKYNLDSISSSTDQPKRGISYSNIPTTSDLLNYLLHRTSRIKEGDQAEMTADPYDDTFHNFDDSVGIGTYEYPMDEINACDPSPCINAGMCSTSSDGEFICSCLSGFRGELCEQVDWCFSNPCENNGVCEISNEYYQCSCLPGNTGRHCEIVLDSCLSNPCLHGRCRNRFQRFVCICFSGYTGTVCDQDINECEIGNVCLLSTNVCLNTEGSFRCLQSITCGPGYQPSSDGSTCQDTNECEEIPASCGSGSCVNTRGAYYCTCSPGYVVAADGKSCRDFNECETVDCGDSGTCINTPGSYKCECGVNEHFDKLSATCLISKPKGSDGSQQNRDETDDTSLVFRSCYADDISCSVLLIANITEQHCCCTFGKAWGQCSSCPRVGTDSFRNLCPHGHGLVADPSTFAAKDIDECSLFGHSVACPNGKCVNAKGSFQCICYRGFYYNRRIHACKDFDECSLAHKCVGGKCVNMIGSFHCQCPHDMVARFYHIGVRCEKPSRGEPTTRRTPTETRSVATLPMMPPLRHLPVSEPCYTNEDESSLCTEDYERNTTYKECCCTIGRSWGKTCSKCPNHDSPDFQFLCRRLPRRDPVHHQIDQLPQEICGIEGGCENGICVRLVNGYTCKCNNGYRLNPNNMLCEDLNECLQHNAAYELCIGGRCVNTVGSFLCDCLPGYQPSSFNPAVCIPANVDYVNDRPRP